MDSIELPGVRVTVMRSRGARGDRMYWRARTTTKARRTVWTGWATRQEALLEVADVVRRGEHCTPSSPEVVRTLADLLEAWAAHQRQREAVGQIAPRTLSSYERHAGYWVAALGDVRVDRLRRDAAEDTLQRWLARGVATRSCSQAARILRMALKWGHDRGLCPDLDLRRLEGARVKHGEFVNTSVTPEDREVQAVLGVLTGKYRDAIDLCALTGCRVGEAVALRVGDYRGEFLTLHGRDLERGRRGKVAARRFPVLGRLRDLLDRLVDGRPEDAAMVEGLPSSASHCIHNQLVRACDRAGVRRFTSHGLRRRRVMDLLLDNNPKMVSVLTGHSVTVMLRDYVRPSTEDLTEAVQRTERRNQRSGKVIPLRGTAPGTNG